MEYLFDHEWVRERERLRKLEEVFDPHTHADMEAVGIRPGWRCLEVGGGGGSIAEWLSWRVGPTGRVVVTDLETRFLNGLEAANLEVREHDIAADPIEERAYDLVHARAVLEHLPNREMVLDRMITALRPGGWLLIECADFDTCRAMSPDHDELFTRVFRFLHSILGERGFHDTFGRQLAWQFRRRELEEIRFEGRIFEWGGPGPITDFYVQTFERLRLEAGNRKEVGAEELDRFFEILADPEFRAVSHLTCAVRGRKPAP